MLRKRMEASAGFKATELQLPGEGFALRAQGEAFRHGWGGGSGGGWGEAMSKLNLELLEM